MPQIKNEIDNYYFEFIQIALAKSDAVMLVNKKYHYNNKVLSNNFDNYDDYILSFTRNKVWKDRFNKVCKPFLKSMEPYLLKIRHDSQWPSTIIGNGGMQLKNELDIMLYKSCDELLYYLIQPQRLFNWSPPDYPEDLCFFKNNYCWFRTTSHEHEAYLHAENEKDLDLWKRFGLEFADEFDEHFDLHERYYEEY